MPQIRLNNHVIAKGQPPFIISEVGINHNGDVKNALKMINVAKAAGVDAVKFQTFRAEEIVSDPNQTYTYKSQGKEITESMLEMFKRCEMSKEDWIRIKKKCDDEKILFLSTPQNRSDLDLLLELGITAIKVGSDDFTNLPLIKDYTSTGLPLLLSCGMADQDEIYQSLNTVGALDGYPTILLLTTSQYPTPPEDVNLLKLKTLEKAFPNIPLGYSDHTQGALASSLAVALGAVVFEKHFTLDHDMPGPDHWFSEDPTGLKEWVSAIKNSFLMLGSSLVKPSDKEIEMRNIARRSIVAVQDIGEGEKFNKNNLGLRRPGSGLPPSIIEQIYDLKSVRKIKKGELIKFGDFKS
ncbi:MAG: N-acetylneuraminate synthase family protein [Thaumarchaeota archaeon]|nr:N-acetylneuraminate synthase family protein [Nitrososphaerota archaeon]